MESKDLSFEEIVVGMSASFTRVCDDEAIAAFADISGDKNPLHVDDAYASTTKFSKRVVHGMFLGALGSQLVGMHLPGKKCLLLKESLTFKQPVFVGDEVVVKGEVISKSESTRILTVLITVTKGEEVCAEGEFVTQVL